MRGYDRDEVEEYDEYEDEGEEQYEDAEEGEEEEEYEEEERKPTEEELEYLELRQKLKERYRKNLKRENGSARASSQDKKNRFSNDNYGSFFGPSQPVISQRVIQESKSLLETHHLASRLPNSHRNNEKTSASNTNGSKNGVHRQIPKLNEMQKKLNRIKVSRDYSFLSDDAELPARKKDPPARNVSVPNSEVRSAQMPPKSKQSLGGSGRNLHGAREERKLVSSNGQTHLAHEERKLVSSNGQMNMAREERKLVSSNGQMNSARERKLVSSNGQMHSKAGAYKPASANKPNLAPVDSRKQYSSSNGMGAGRPTGPKALPSKVLLSSMEKRASAPGAKNHLPSAKIQPSSRILPSVQKKHIEQRKGPEEHNRSKIISRQPVVSSKPQINKPLKQISSHAKTQDQRPKKKPVRRFSDDEGGDDDAMAFSMLRNMLGPRKYATYDDDDDSDMEAGFDDIMREESISEKIARKEDEEQLRLIEEEERLERKRKLAKKRKLSH